MISATYAQFFCYFTYHVHKYTSFRCYTQCAPIQLQGYIRGWLIRRRWKRVIQDYLASPQASLMRKRNQVREQLELHSCDTHYVALHQSRYSLALACSAHLEVCGFRRRLRESVDCADRGVQKTVRDWSPFS